MTKLKAVDSSGSEPSNKKQRLDLYAAANETLLNSEETHDVTEKENLETSQGSISQETQFEATPPNKSDIALKSPVISPILRRHPSIRTDETLTSLSADDNLIRLDLDDKVVCSTQRSPSKTDSTANIDQTANNRVKSKLSRFIYNEEEKHEDAAASKTLGNIITLSSQCDISDQDLELD